MPFLAASIPDHLSTLLTNIENKGWHISDDFLETGLLNELYRMFSLLRKNNAFNKAGIGNGKINESQRTDVTCWIDRDTAIPAVQSYLLIIEELTDRLNKAFYFGLQNIELHAAIYPPGSFYKKHLDNLKNQGKRQLTFILYLNKDWQREDGGELLMYIDEKINIIEPIFGRFVCFLSTDFYHEVKTTNKERLSLTGWLSR